jgi:hypothetical protein
MQTLSGISVGGEGARELEVERRDDEVYLYLHPPGNRQSGQEIVVNRKALIDAVRGDGGRLDGTSPTQGNPKECIVERRPDGLCLQIHPTSGLSSWWIVVREAELAAATSS